MKTKKCRKCGEVKTVDMFYKRVSGEAGFHYMCKDCMKLYYRNRWKSLPVEEKELRRKRYIDWFDAIKKRIFDHYGRACVCCGETNVEFLTIDHINGGGVKHRKSLGGGTAFFRWLCDENFPTEFRVLCMNCNFSLGRFGYCPHMKGE
jgi:hypothetical protein